MNYLFPFSATFTYLIVCTLAVEMFHQLKMEIETTVVDNSGCLTINHQMEFSVTKWRSRYIQLTQLIDSINQCFGLILLQTTVYLFFVLINGSFFVSVLMKSQIPTFRILNHCYGMCFFIFILLAVAYLPCKLRSEVNTKIIMFRYTKIYRNH